MADNKLNKNKETLGTMLTDLRNSSTLTAGIGEQTKKASDIVKRTNFLFSDANSSNPKFIFTNSLQAININNQRKNINSLLSFWQKQAGFFLVKNVSLEESEQIKKDAQVIKVFLENLSQILASLTPGNSGLSQSEIDAYLSQLPSLDEINEVLTSLDGVVENYNVSHAQTFYIGNETGEVSSPTYSSSSSPSSLPTVDDILAQQAFVTEAQAEVGALQEQLAAVEEQIQQLSSAPTPPSSPPVVPEVVVPENPNPDIYSNLPPREPITSQGIIIQPGPPRLIQGTDSF